MRRAAFWAAVAVVSVLANTAAEAIAEKVPSTGLKRLVAYTHRGNA